MQLLLDLDGETPIYQQIRDRMVEAIADGHLAAGAALPSARQLAVDLAINFHTVNKAYDLLRREGIIRINRKSGAIVHPGVKQPATEAEAAADWRRRARTLLAEADVRGLPKEEIQQFVRTTLDQFPDRDDAGTGRPATAPRPGAATAPRSTTDRNGHHSC